MDKKIPQAEKEFAELRFHAYKLEEAIRNIIAGCRKSNCYRVIKKKRIDDFYIGEDLILAARDALEGK